MRTVEIVFVQPVHALCLHCLFPQAFHDLRFYKTFLRELRYNYSYLDVHLEANLKFLRIAQQFFASFGEDLFHHRMLLH